MPMTELPPAQRDGIYRRQLAALKGARKRVGKLTRNGLSAMGVGNKQTEKTLRQEIAAVRAGMNLGKAHEAKDLYMSAAALWRPEGTEFTGDTPERQEYDKTIFARNSVRVPRPIFLAQTC